MAKATPTTSSKTTTTPPADPAIVETPTAGGEEALVRVYHLNRSKGSFIHGEHRLDPGGNTVVPQSVADLWTSHKDSGGAPLVGTALGEASPPTAEANRLKAELEASKSENTELDARVKALEAQLAAAQAAKQ